MRISDWSSDVCSSDLILRQALMGDGTPRPEDILGMYAMRVRVGDNQKTMEITIGHAPGWEKVPQGRMTALPTSYVAQQVERGHITEKGVCVPEQFSDELRCEGRRGGKVCVSTSRSRS